MTKNLIRNYQKQIRNEISVEEQRSLSRAIFENLLSTEAYKDCCRLITYVSFRSEADTYEIIRSSMMKGKKVYIPRVEPQGIDFYQLYQLEDLIPSKLGIPEPIAKETDRYITNDKDTEKSNIELSKPSEDNKKLSSKLPYRNLMLLPGLAFDPNGNRIGYGAGYYDKYLSSHPKEEFYKIALAYDFQVIDKIEADEYDIKVDMIITPTRIISQARYSF